MGLYVQKNSAGLMMEVVALQVGEVKAKGQNQKAFMPSFVKFDASGAGPFLFLASPCPKAPLRRGKPNQGS